MEDTISRLYNKILNRDPDVDGIDTYTSFLSRRKPSDLEKVLYASDEFKENIRKKKKIFVFMCVRNNGKDLPHTLDALQKIRRADTEYEYAYYIFENDSVDNTVELCRTFMMKNHGVFHTDVLNKKQWGDVKDVDRVTDMSIYRNKCMSLCDDVSVSDYCVVVDTKVTFSANIIRQFLHVLKDDSIAMVTPFGKVGSKPVYYDTYALEFKDRPKQVKMNKGIVDVLSACGGIFMVKTPAMLSATWKVVDGNKSEHNAFCYTVSDYGRVVIDTSIHTEWVK